MSAELLELLTITIEQVENLRNDTLTDLLEVKRRLISIRTQLREALQEQTPPTEQPNTV